MKDGRNYVFWGVRDKKIEFKLHTALWRIQSLINANEGKGFRMISPEHYELICPNFKEDLEIWFTASILADSFK